MNDIKQIPQCQACMRYLTKYKVTFFDSENHEIINIEIRAPNYYSAFQKACTSASYRTTQASKIEITILEPKL